MRPIGAIICSISTVSATTVCEPEQSWTIGWELQDAKTGRDQRVEPHTEGQVIAPRLLMRELIPGYAGRTHL